MITPTAVRKSWPWLAAASSGLLLALCFAPFEQPGWVWIALLPLLGALWSSPDDAPNWRAPLLGYTTGIVFFSVTFYWLSELADLFENPFLYGLPLLLAVYLALYPAAWAWLVSRPPAAGTLNAGASLRNITFTVRAACAWVALDWLRGWLFTGFGWNTPGIALHNNLALIQIADLFGVYGVTFLVVFTSVTLGLVLRNIAQTASIRALPNLRIEIMSAILMVGMAVSYGVRTVLQRSSNQTIPLRIVALQPNIPQEEKFDASEEGAVLEKIDKLMQVAVALQPASDLFLWPEAATPRGMFADEANHAFTMNQVSRAKAPLLLGTLEPAPTGPEGSGEMLEYNSAVLLSGADAPA